MNSNDSSNKQSNIKLRHMFQSSDDLNHGIYYIPDTLDHEKMNKISVKFTSEKKQDVSLLDSVRNMIELSKNNPTQSLLDYIEELKSLYRQKESIEIETTIDEPNVEEVKIDQIISQTEKDLLKSKDQKLVLFDLINDINKTSTTKSSFDEERFTQNIASLINDHEEEEKITIKDSKKDTKVSEMTNTKEEAVTKGKKKKTRLKRRKGKLIAFLLFVVFGLSIIFYLYKDKFIDLLSNYV